MDMTSQVSNPSYVQKVPWLFLIPAIGLIAFIVGYPLARTAWLSFTDAKLSTLSHPRWIGWENYAFLLKDPYWWRAVLNTLVFTFCSVSIETVLGLAFALVMNEKFPGRGALRASVLIPWAIPAVVSARIWAWMANDLYGVINEVLLRTGLIHERIAWLADDRLALATLVVVDVWKTTPFMALLVLAGLQNVPRSVLEASRVDGASTWKRFRYITLPLIRPAIGVAVIFRMLDALRVFDLPFVLTSNSRSTAVMSVYARQQLIDFQDAGYGSAASVVIFFIIGVIAILYVGLTRPDLGPQKGGEP